MLPGSPPPEPRLGVRGIVHDARVTDDVERSRAVPLGAAMGERLGGFIYGTIVALAAIVAGAKAYPDASGRIAAFVVVTTGVLWVAHVYSHGLAYSVAHNQHLSLAELGHIARREASIVEAAVPSVAALLLGVLGLVSTEVAVWAALGLGLAVLAIQGVHFARVEQLAWLGTIAVVATNVGLGLLLIGLKLLVSH
jgi:hypothetical protein